MKKILLTATTALLLTAASAYANEFNVNVDLGTPAIVEPAFVAPAPAIIINPYVPQVYDPRHRAHDWRYWQERRAHGYHDYHDGHHDHHDHDDHWDHR